MIRTGIIGGRAVTGQVIDGRKIAGDLEAEIAGEARDLKAAGVTAGIATVLIGGDAASIAYERRIARTAAALGVTWQQHRLAVPGGIGPVTDVQLIRNTVAAARGAIRARAA